MAIDTKALSEEIKEIGRIDPAAYLFGPRLPVYNFLIRHIYLRE
jgi:hypothetical protein